MIRVLMILLVGGIIIVGVPAAFYFYVGVDASISTNAKDWATFGSYFGGVAGALLSFTSILLILFTISQQKSVIEQQYDDSIKRDLLQYVSKSSDEIDNWLKKYLASTHDNKTVEFGDIVWGIVNPEYANKTEFNAAINRLLKLTCSYCTSIALYKDNVDTYFIYDHHKQKAEDLIDFLAKHDEALPQMSGPSLALCKHQITRPKNQE
jgi:hypothetical protein